MKKKTHSTPTAFTVKWMSDLYTACYSDVACALDISLEAVSRDMSYVAKRLAKEGASFMTKALPLLGKMLDKQLSKLETTDEVELPFPGWQLQSMSKLPVFCGELFSMVLATDGSVRSDANPHALGRLRQLLYLFYKVEFPPTDEQNRKTIDKFVLTEHLLPEPDESIFKRNGSVFNHIEDIRDHLELARVFREKWERNVWILQQARAIVRRVLGNTDPRDETRLRPRHGPGAVATGERSHEKPIFRRYYERLHAVFPYDTYMSYNLSSVNDEWEGWQGLESKRDSTAKVVLVPKDSRGPRIISCEPLEIQWIQQALMTILVEEFEVHSLTRDHVNFKRQDINRELALVSSIGTSADECDQTAWESTWQPDPCKGRLPKGPHHGWITMDMKDASDCVSLALVRYLFPRNWVEALEASRSQYTKLPDGQIVKLKKFAPMGSAVCFPVEAMVFYSICVAAQQYQSGDSRMPPKAPSDYPYVYGDDLIVQSQYYEVIEEALESVHLKVNHDKCCRGRWFRESCGMDAFKGICVTPLKIRQPLGCRSRTALFSWIEYHNWFSKRGYDNAALWIRQYLEKTKDARYIIVMDEIWLNGQVPGYAYLHVAGERPHTLKGYLRSRYNDELHRREFLAWGVTTCSQEHLVPGWSEMLRRASQTGLSPERESKTRDQLPPHLRKKVEARAYEYALAHGVVRKCAWYPALVG